MSAQTDEYETSETEGGFRLSQHGVVLSEMRNTTGPTHSVFDVLAALVAVLEPVGRVGILGFAGGSMMAPLRFLGVENAVESVDLDRAGYDLFAEHCSAWAGKLKWKRADANDWLEKQPPNLGLLIDDLSIPVNDDVVKPGCSWSTLPALMKSRVGQGGVVISNQLKPDGESWVSGMKTFTTLFSEVQVVHLDDFENRIVIAAEKLPPIRETSKRLKATLDRLGSEQVGLFRMRSLV
jgi:hypothetical protein